jgi:hypothetical protein
MPVIIVCPQCSMNLEIPAAGLGMHVRCTECKNVFLATTPKEHPSPIANQPDENVSPQASPEPQFEEPLVENVEPVPSAADDKSQFDESLRNVIKAFSSHIHETVEEPRRGGDKPEEEPTEKKGAVKPKDQWLLRLLVMLAGPPAEQPGLFGFSLPATASAI